MIIKVIVICVFTAAVTLLIKDSVYSKVLGISTGILTLWLILPYISDFVRYIKSISSTISGLESTFKTTMKIIGISFLCEFATQFCNDAGESYLASKINFAGKLLIICIVAPDFVELINNIIKLINKI